MYLFYAIDVVGELTVGESPSARCRGPRPLPSLVIMIMIAHHTTNKVIK